jgi:GcrA cell cycle regulator
MAWKWTTERVETLRTLWADGLSGSQIARRMRAPTHNTVLGKMARLGLTGQTGPRKPRKSRARRPRVQPVSLAGSTAPRERIAPLPGPKLVPCDLPPADVSEPATDFVGPRLSVLGLNARTCKWPFGDGPFTFCGRPVKSGSVYCSGHHARAYDGVPKRKPVDRTVYRPNSVFVEAAE